MVSGPSALSGNSLIRYRPDPGEPAARLTAPETQTALLVTSQEQRNETRLRAQAIARGDDVVFSNRTFTLGVGNYSPIYNGGLTTVSTRSDANGFAPDSVPVATATDEPSQTEDEPVEEEARAVPEDPQEAAEPTEEELQQEQQNLDNEESRLERNLTRAQLEQDQALQSADGVQYQQAERDQAQIEREQDDLDREKRQNELDQIDQRLQDSLDTATSALLGSANAASGVLDILFGLNSPTTIANTAPTPALAGNGGPGFYAGAARLG
ncbi:CCDC90 family protein [bacterium]|nr:CCDC90 family protein [bacterium]